MILVSGNITCMGIFARVPLGGGIKWEWGCRRRQFLAIWVVLTTCHHLLWKTAARQVMDEVLRTESSSSLYWWSARPSGKCLRVHSSCVEDSMVYDSSCTVSVDTLVCAWSHRRLKILPSKRYLILKKIPQSADKYNNNNNNNNNYIFRKIKAIFKYIINTEWSKKSDTPVLILP